LPVDLRAATSYGENLEPRRVWSRDSTASPEHWDRNQRERGNSGSRRGHVLKPGWPALVVSMHKSGAAIEGWSAVPSLNSLSSLPYLLFLIFSAPWPGVNAGLETCFGSIRLGTCTNRVPSPPNRSAEAEHDYWLAEVVVEGVATTPAGRCREVCGRRANRETTSIT
jgi:hypothetical protein